MGTGARTHEFGKTFWEDHWARSAAGEQPTLPVNPYLLAETSHLATGTALDAGCGTGSEAVWLAEHGWLVTGADISATALAIAAERATAAGVDGRIEWVEADLTRWQPARAWDLVVTGYVHASIDQLALYRRIASWVAPGGTMLIVGHLSGHHDSHGSHEHPEGATASRDGIPSVFAAPGWRVDADYENVRTVHAGGHRVRLRDVIVRARRTA